MTIRETHVVTTAVTDALADGQQRFRSLDGYSGANAGFRGLIPPCP